MTRNDVTSSFVQIVDVDPSQAHEVLSRINPMRSLADRLSALGLDDRAMWARGSEELSYQLVWRFGADGGHAKLVWRLAVHTDGAGRTVLSLRLEGRGSDMNARSPHALQLDVPRGARREPRSTPGADGRRLRQRRRVRRGRRAAGRAPPALAAV